MRAREFVAETRYGNAGDKPANAKLMAKSAVTAIKGAISMPDLSQNKQGGSPYLQWRFGIAMAGAPDYPTPPVGAVSGDPLLATYTDVDLEIINSAAKMIGVGEVKKLTDNRSSEHEAVHRVSPVRPFAGYAR
jgi:hypothetical protein